MRASTIHKRVREWAKYRRWLEGIQRVGWPEELPHVVDYLMDLRETGAPFSVPRAFGAALSFFEKAAGLPPGGRLSEDPTYRKALDQVIRDKEMLAKERKVAPLYPVKVIIALELLVVDEEQPELMRFMAWVKLFKIWTASRTGDLMGLSPQSLRLGKAGLQGVYWQTKVSGPGKKNRFLPLMVSREATLAGVEWLERGWEILRGDYWFERDYLVPTYCKIPATYGDFVVWTRQLMLTVRDSEFDGVRW